MRKTTSQHGKWTTQIIEASRLISSFTRHDVDCGPNQRQTLAQLVKANRIRVIRKGQIGRGGQPTVYTRA